MLQYPISITIDTNIFDECKYDFLENSTLYVLQNYVQEGKVKVYLSNIVLSEAKAHLERKASALVSIVKKNRRTLLNEVDEKNVKYMGLDKYLELPNESEILKKMSDLFEEYIKSLKPEIFDYANIDLDIILDDYFNYNAPFEKTIEKRKEFPDAFIASQIRGSFPSNNSFIISKDKGLKKACSLDNEYCCLDCLGDLYKMITEQDNDYQTVIAILEKSKDDINSLVREEIEKDDCVTVDGRTWDRKGVVSGYDYSDISIRNISNISHKLSVVDDINEDEALITLSCFADIEVDCYYEDYDNAPWDSEMKDYMFLETKHILEKHRAEFEVRTVLDLRLKRIVLDDISIMLNVDTREDRILLYDEETAMGDDSAYTICPDCGRSITHQNDGGNGFCIDCAPNH